MTYQKHPSKKL